MTLYGFHASHEQVHPRALLDAVKRAEAAGFEAAMCSDHFAPWSDRQGESGFAWSWLGAALEATNLRFGVVNAPGQRYHPAIIAQAAATLGAMYPGRFWAALGSGEAMNEHITGDAWPRKELRDQRLEESVDVIRALFRGEEVSREGLVTVDRARLWTLPETQPALIGPAVSVATAGRVASWADGLVTINQPHDHLRDMIAAYRDAGGKGTLALQIHLSYARTEDEALAVAHDQWRSNVFAPPLCWDLDTPASFDEASRHVEPDDVRSSVVVSADLGELVDVIGGYADLGFDEVYLHHVGKEQTEFIDVFGEHVLPALRAAGTTATTGGVTA
ncbi:TIGR03885 family FMN-dependent LLM class oxidoreductase [Sanguibacter suaedae]|uniref:TIGR03885 family FMN-dependent LLM class oxidoreductase n=1 Tax=Sanguibacter suaedae TaxID=2795737 RepID=A0A934I0Z1_9MICO|nr:TIGR03885 family FMN-dependent LLM class oxidoreductase [Sanguibacter suaedae]MBI9113569.1 TIGR03885 family FMN-dependent LLM class oxidoreductase [Sanguibacter suaedae]